MSSDAASDAIREFLPPSVRIDGATAEREEEPGTDSFGNPGRVVAERIRGRGVADEDREALVAGYGEAGYTLLPRDALREDDLVRLRLDRLDSSDPFLWTNEVEVGIGGRKLSDGQRSLLERKADALRTELSTPDLPGARRERSAGMLAELERGLLPSVSVLLSRRRFVPDPLLTPGGSMGRVVPLGFLSQLVYTVVPADPAHRDDGGGEPMYLTVLGVAERRVAFLFSGGLHGQRTVTDLEDAVAHHAWFRNRRHEEVAETAPWLSRSVYRELTGAGRSRVIVRRERDGEPIELTRTGEGQAILDVGGEPSSVPVVHATTARDDELTVLADPESPLVLRLVETGADLLRTVDAVRTLAS